MEKKIIFEKIINDYYKVNSTEIIKISFKRIKREFEKNFLDFYVISFLNSFKNQINYFFINRKNGEVLQYSDFTTRELRKIL